jgi:AcrR family transcriptional regulator
MNVSSLGVSPGEVAPEDLTGRARIRLAALRQFAEHGFAGASMRMVAEAAGVSVGLVQHHFGSKARLREECDAFVMDYVRAQARAAFDEQHAAEADFLREVYRGATPVLNYLAAALAEGSPGAAAVFDEMVTMARDYLPESLSVPGTDGDTVSAGAVAAVLTAMKLGISVLREHVIRALELGDDAEVVHREISRALLAIVSPEVTGPSIGKLAGRGLAELSAREREESRD